MTNYLIYLVIKINVHVLTFHFFLSTANLAFINFNMKYSQKLVSY